MTVARGCTRRLVLATLVLALSALPAVGSAQVTPAPSFRVGDAVRINVWTPGALGPGGMDLLYSGDFGIAEDGTIIHPLYRTVRIVGLSMQQAEQQIREQLRGVFEEPRLVIEPLFQIPVAGEVRAPNIFALPPQSTLMVALARAGGPTEFADLRNVILLRDGVQYPFDLARPGNEFSVIHVRSGDQIIVNRRTSLWRDRINPAIQTVGALSAIVFLVLEIRNQTQ